MAGWRTLSSEEVYASPWIRVRRDEVLNQHGTPLTYSVVELRKKPSVFIVALNGAGQVLLQKIYRYPVNQTWWEVPAGFCEGEELLATAQRELLEETGLASEKWTELSSYSLAPGLAVIPCTAFLAQDVKPANGARDAEEDIGEQRFFDFAEAEELVRRGEIQDAPTIIALYLTRLHLDQQKRRKA